MNSFNTLYSQAWNILLLMFLIEEERHFIHKHFNREIKRIMLNTMETSCIHSAKQPFSSNSFAPAAPAITFYHKKRRLLYRLEAYTYEANTLLTGRYRH